MFTFEKSDIQRFAISSVGAVAVSAAFLLAAAGPARAATPTTTTEWQQQVQRQIETSRQDLSMLDGVRGVKTITLAARFTAAGDYAGADIAKSSGNARLDRGATQIVGHVAYPALPAAYRGQPQTVTMRLYFGTDAQQVADAIAKAPVQFAFTTNAGGAGARMTAR